jgi:hypothetical protein
MAATEFVLWGWKPSYCPLGLPIKLSGGRRGHCNARHRAYEAEGFKCAVYPAGSAPEGFRLQVAQWAGGGK